MEPNYLVSPGNGYEGVEDPPLDHVRMAWPFKTEQELLVLSKWFKREEARVQKSEDQKRKAVLEKAGKALV